jgi:hypothetical protein
MHPPIINTLAVQVTQRPMMRQPPIDNTIWNPAAFSCCYGYLALEILFCRYFHGFSNLASVTLSDDTFTYCPIFYLSRHVQGRGLLVPLVSDRYSTPLLLSYCLHRLADSAAWILAVMAKVHCFIKRSSHFRRCITAIVASGSAHLRGLILRIHAASPLFNAAVKARGAPLARTGFEPVTSTVPSRMVGHDPTHRGFRLRSP